MTRLMLVLLIAAAAGSTITTYGQAPQNLQPKGRNPRLFAPQDLGLLEPPDREAWQKPDQVMDALRVAEGTTL